MDKPVEEPSLEPQFPPPLTPESVRRAQEQVERIHAQIRARGIDMSQLPDPVEALSKARETVSNALYWRATPWNCLHVIEEFARALR